MVELRGGAAVVIRRWNRKGLTILDTLIVLCLIGILIGVVIPKYQRVAREAQESALKAELSSIRTSIKLFRLLNGRNPERLQELLEKQVMIPAQIGADPYTGSIFNQKYLMQQAVDAQGHILDSFGNPYSYDAVQGEVRATTKGFEMW
jgi:type II secretory pathway pseudopilin PulG